MQRLSRLPDSEALLLLLRAGTDHALSEACNASALSTCHGHEGVNQHLTGPTDGCPMTLGFWHRGVIPRRSVSASLHFGPIPCVKSTLAQARSSHEDYCSVSPSLSTILTWALYPRSS